MKGRYANTANYVRTSNDSEKIIKRTYNVKIKKTKIMLFGRRLNTCNLNDI